MRTSGSSHAPCPKAGRRNSDTYRLSTPPAGSMRAMRVTAPITSSATPTSARAVWGEIPRFRPDERVRRGLRAGGRVVRRRGAI